MNIPWSPLVLLLVFQSSPRQIDFAVPGSAMPMRLCATEEDAACLELFSRGTLILAQVDKSTLLDWTLAPTRTMGKPPREDGEFWKDA